MPGQQGRTTTGSLADSLPTIIDSARTVREYEGVMLKLVDKNTLNSNSGLAWDEISLEQLNAQAVTETTVLDSPQLFQDTLFSITPTVVGIHTVVTDRVQKRISANVAARMGVLAQNAMNRKKDEDLITVLDGATTSLVGAGSEVTENHIAAAVKRIQSNATEPAVSGIYTVLHGFQTYNLQSRLLVGVPTYPIPSGLTESVYRMGFRGSIVGSELFEDGNITIDSGDDAKGGVFAREAIVHVQGMSPRGETQRWPHYGGGADALWMYDEYGNGERSAGNWMYEIFADATSPTS